MPSHDTWLNVLTGLSQGSFDTLYVKNANGVMVNVLSLGGSGGSYTHPSNHPISMITGLQSALDGKADDSQVLTNVPVNALFTDTLYTHPSQHSISMITGLQGELNNKADSTTVSAGFAGVATDLLSKQDTLTAGSNITISGNTISASGGSSLALQLAGVAQAASTLNFANLSGSLASGVLTIHLRVPMHHCLWSTAQLPRA